MAGDKPVNTGCAPEVRNVLDAADLVFTIVFAVDLAINLYSHWFRPFFTNGWSLFDLVVVAFSLVALDPSLNLPVNVVRTIRAFRVCRSFGKIGELKRIVNAISKSVIPVMNGEFPTFLPLIELQHLKLFRKGLMVRVPRTLVSFSLHGILSAFCELRTP